MARDPFQFLKDLDPAKRLTLLLLAVIRKNGGEVQLSVTDLTSIDDGSGLFNSLSDRGDEIILRFARRGAEAYFLSDDSSPSQPKIYRKPIQPPQPLDQQPSPARHAVHDDIDLALREDEMAARSQAAQKRKLDEARAAAGAMPWRTVKPQ